MAGSSANSSILRVDVEEQPTGDFSLVGYSSIEKGTLSLGINEKTF